MRVMTVQFLRPSRRAALAAILGLCSAVSFAQGAPAFPTRPVTVITTFSAGSGPDAMMRAAAEKLAAMWKTPVIIENRPGGAGLIAIQAAQGAAPDGHVLLMHDGDALSALPSLFPSRGLRLLGTFDPVGVLYTTPFFVVVSSNSTWKSVGDLLVASRKAPEKTTYGTWGVGSAAHLHSAALLGLAGARMTHVPYKEMSLLYTGVSTGEIDWALGAMASTQFVYQSGKVKYLAVARSSRLANYPDVPTVAESGGPAGFEASGFVALLLPKGAPEAIANKINKDLQTALASSELRAHYKTFNFDVAPLSPTDTRRLLEARTSTYAQVVRTNNIKLD
jgi:tripartite-type tricarboxylate transporter receptor subunit TctC